ncbi:MAG TPA: MBL fold metallo-hydrolase [Pyrinomonadaceae bacterium]|nr:MBL fold metallo-hydrolase [Pyrinomonadaceae bacterium]
MASIQKRLPENVPGDFYVDTTCIDCDACRQIAPETFREFGEHSVVYRQPETEAQARLALMSLVACPTGSIGARGHHDFHVGIDAFPSHLAENIYFCGFTSESSFGAWSYLIQRPEAEGGNVLVDSPRFATQLTKRLTNTGGVRQMFLTHRDDVADHQRFAELFGCERVMHAADGAQRLGIERVIAGEAEVRLDDELVIIPTPGHTRGHMVLLYKNKFLFTGDHLAWSPARGTLTAFRSVNWYSWPEQIRSMERLLDYDFEWVLPGHGRIHHDSCENMRTHLKRCIAWMKER